LLNDVLSAENDSLSALSFGIFRQSIVHQGDMVFVRELPPKTFTAWCLHPVLDQRPPDAFKFNS